MNELKQQIIKDMEQADSILIGLGEEVSLLHFTEEEMQDKESGLRTVEKDYEMAYFLQKEKQKEHLKLKKFYSILRKLTADKNYFIVTTNTDDSCYWYWTEQEKIVAPCGSYQRLQCENNCSDEVYEMSNFEGKAPFICPKCKAVLRPNIHDHSPYCEKGYLAQWEVYTKWLQHTLNKKLCILELGVGFGTPSVIRWPFEKIAYFNQKASFYRIHSRFNQLSEEISEKGNSIKENPVDFFLNLDISGKYDKLI